MENAFGTKVKINFIFEARTQTPEDQHCERYCGDESGSA